MGTYAYDATNDTLDLIAGRGNTDALAAKLSKTSDNIAPKQATNTASELIPVGKYFINANGDLCQCDVQIASGGSIIIGSNCHLIPDGGINDLEKNDMVLGQINFSEVLDPESISKYKGNAVFRVANASIPMAIKVKKIDDNQPMLYTDFSAITRYGSDYYMGSAIIMPKGWMEQGAYTSKIIYTKRQSTSNEGVAVYDDSDYYYVVFWCRAGVVNVTYYLMHVWARYYAIDEYSELVYNIDTSGLTKRNIVTVG